MKPGWVAPELMAYHQSSIDPDKVVAIGAQTMQPDCKPGESGELDCDQRTEQPDPPALAVQLVHPFGRTIAAVGGTKKANTFAMAAPCLYSEHQRHRRQSETGELDIDVDEPQHRHRTEQGSHSR